VRGDEIAMAIVYWRRWSYDNEDKEGEVDE